MSTPHIVGICETWLTSKVTPLFQNYKVVRTDRVGRRGGGLAFLIRKDLKFSLLHLNRFKEGHMEVMAIRVEFWNGWGHFVNCYNPNKNISKEEFNHYFQQVPSPQFIYGDFNAHHRFWDPSLPRSAENPTGRALFDILPVQQFCLLNPLGIPTRIDPYSGKASTLDLCFGSGIFNDPISFRCGNNMGSDHFPITVDYENISPLVLQVRRPKWKFDGDKSKWNGFIGCTSNNDPIPETLYESSLSDKVKYNTDVIVEAGKKCFYLGPGKICKKPSKPW